MTSRSLLGLCGCFWFCVVGYRLFVGGLVSGICGPRIPGCKWLCVCYGVCIVVLDVGVGETNGLCGF